MAILLSLMWSLSKVAAISHDTGSLPPYNSQPGNLHATLFLAMFFSPTIRCVVAIFLVLCNLEVM